MNLKRPYLEIFLISFAALLLETSYTRVFSFKLFYYFTYFIIGIALLGLGSGGILVAILPRLRRADPDKLIPVFCLSGAGIIGAGYLVVALLQVNTSQLWSSNMEVVKLAAVCGCLFAAFLSVGVLIAAMFAAHPGNINRLYFADLLGAGLGCAVVVPLMAVISPPACVLLAGCAMGVGALRLAYRQNRLVFNLGLVLSAVLLCGALFPQILPDPRADKLKILSPQRSGGENILFSKWSPVFRVDVLEWALSGGKMRVLAHDGQFGSTLHRFDRDVSTLSRFDTDARSIPFAMARSQPEVLIIGAAGGHEVLASLYFGAAHTTAVELNPVTVSLLTDHFADYSGHLPDIESVSYITAEGRSFLKNRDKEYDIIYFVAPDSYSSMNAATSGAFVLSESYLYTREMIVDSLNHLKEDGIIAMQFGEVAYDLKPNRTARYMATAREAFEVLGVDEFSRHVLVSTSPGLFTFSTILLKPEPFSPEEVTRFVRNVAKVPDSQVRFARGQDFSGGPVDKVISLSDEELDRWFDAYPYDVSAVTDNAPFFWHFARFRDVLKGQRNRTVGDLEDSLGERVLVFLLLFATLFGAVFLLLPFMAIHRTWRALPYKSRTALYFATLGLGFMFYEIYLIQRLTLFLGYPTYSLTVTLMAILISAGCGSLLSERYAKRPETALRSLLLLLAFLTGFYLFGITPVISGLVGEALWLRILISVVCIAPLGLCLGAFLPLGLTVVASLSSHKQEYVAWSWAVNGFFSVIGSVLTTIVSMSYGFQAVLILAFLVYSIGVIVLNGLLGVKTFQPAG